MTRFVFRLAEERDEALAAQARRQGISKADVLRLALNEYLEQRDTKPARQPAAA